MNRLQHITMIDGLLYAAALCLLIQPILWLGYLRTDPSYYLIEIFLLGGVLALSVWSGRSALVSCKSITHISLPMIIMLMALSQVITIQSALPSLHALTFMIATFGLAYCFRLHQRKCSASPAWLAISVACALVIWPLGDGLEWLYVQTACQLLSLFMEDVSCYGLYMIQDGKDMLFGIPYGHSALLISPLGIYCLLASYHRLSPHHGITGLACVSGIICVLNSAHIIVTALLLDTALSADTILLWNDTVYGAILLISGCYAWVWITTCHQPAPRIHPVLDQIQWGTSLALQRDGWWLQHDPTPRHMPQLIVVCCLLCAIMVTTMSLHEEQTISPIKIASY